VEEPTVNRRATPPGQRRVGLPDGRELAVRPVSRADVDGLVDLCAGLGDEDRYRRFFSGYTPDRAFFEHSVRIAERGGFGLVAVVTGARAADDSEHGQGMSPPAERGADEDGSAVARIVGEASYELLPNGDGELAMMVATDWRGWLGPYLLDALVEAAAARGVPNIEADVLVTNRPMLEVLRARGYAVMPSDDWVSLRLIIGTAGRTPVWPDGHERPRVLVEVPGGRWHAAAEAKAAGLEVIACSGPRGPRTRCPALSGQPCPLVAGADAVVVSHAPDDARWDRLVDAHQQLHPGVPVCIERRRAQTVAAPGTTGAGRGAIDAGDLEVDREKLVVAIIDRLGQAAGRDGGSTDEERSAADPASRPAEDRPDRA
jgi:hypothetical protein